MPSIAYITAQAAGLSMVSSVLAQAIAAYRSGSSLSLDWEPVVRFFVYAVLSTPPNVLWQVFLEESFPGSPEKEKTEKSPSRPTISWRNTLAKLLLDQSVGACANTLLFCLFLGAWEWLQAGNQNLTGALLAATADFWPLLAASWRFWPWVGLGSFALVPDVATRNLVGGLAGIAWGVYLTLAVN